MADIELVVKLPEEIYKHYKKVWQKRRGSIPESCIAFGTPLPKGHGRLGDLDILREEVSSWGMNDYEPSDFIDEIDRADTIIEASKEQEDAGNN